MNLIFLFLAINLFTIEEEQFSNPNLNEGDKLFSKWKIIKIEGIKNMAIHPSIQFEKEESTVSGFAGCNNFNGGFTLQGKELKFGPIAATRKMCNDMTIEDQFLQQLSKVARYEVVKRELYLYDISDGIVMVGIN